MFAQPRSVPAVLSSFELLHAFVDDFEGGSEFADCGSGPVKNEMCFREQFRRSKQTEAVVLPHDGGPFCPSRQRTVAIRRGGSVLKRQVDRTTFSFEGSGRAHSVHFAVGMGSSFAGNSGGGVLPHTHT